MWWPLLAILAHGTWRRHITDLPALTHHLFALRRPINDVEPALRIRLVTAWKVLAAASPIANQRAKFHNDRVWTSAVKRHCECGRRRE